MSNTGIIFRRELASYFATPVAYVFIFIFLMLGVMALVFLNVAAHYSERSELSRLGRYYAENGPQELGAPNLVTAVVVTYRGLDTLGEVTVLFISAAGVGLLLRRTRRQKGEISLPDLENIEKRAASAWGELRFAHEFDHVIPNHDGEDSDNWDAFYYPLGDARASLNAFVALLRGESSDFAETWEDGLVP